jgi:hypothetical protein
VRTEPTVVAAPTVDPAELQKHYHYVKRDLLRIAVLATIMFVGIYVTTLLL